MDEKCIYCERPATWWVAGYVEDEYTTGAARNPVCDEHKREFEEWERDWNRPETMLLHGFSSIMEIIPIAAQGRNKIAVWKVITTVAGLCEHYPNHEPPTAGGPFLVVELDDRIVVFDLDTMRGILDGYQKAVAGHEKPVDADVPCT